MRKTYIYIFKRTNTSIQDCESLELYQVLHSSTYVTLGKELDEVEFI